MAHAKDGWTHAVMATVSTGEIVVILEFTRERPAREFRRQLDLYYQSRPRKFLDIHVEYMPEATAKLYRHILDESTTSAPTVPVGSAAAPAPAASQHQASRLRQMVHALLRLIGLSH